MLRRLLVIITIAILATIGLFIFAWRKAVVINENYATLLTQKQIEVNEEKTVTSSEVLDSAELMIATSSTTTQQIVSQPELDADDFYLLEVPFTTQAPLAEWSDPRQQDGCEEAAVLMAMAWVNKFAIDKAKARAEIIAMSKYQEDNYGNYLDTDAYDTVQRLVKGYWKYELAMIDYEVTKAKLVSFLKEQRLILAPTNGRLLRNPNFKAPGPMTHMLVIRGYDKKNNQFIVNDPGTKKGEAYRYDAEVLLEAIINYPTGNHLPQDKTKKAIIIFDH